MASIDERLVDKRIVERNIERGLLSDSEYQKYLKELTDMEENADVLRVYDDGSTGASGTDGRARAGASDGED
jgi:hypothetical protein